MSKYRKLIVAVIGLALLVANEFFGIDVAIGAEVIAEPIVAILTAWGVFQVSNATDTA